MPIADSVLEQLLSAGSARPARITWAELPDPGSGAPVSDLLWDARGADKG